MAPTLPHWRRRREAMGGEAEEASGVRGAGGAEAEVARPWPRRRRGRGEQIRTIYGKERTNSRGKK